MAGNAEFKALPVPNDARPSLQTKENSTTAGGRRSRRLPLLRSALFRSECRRPDLRARGPACSFPPQELAESTRSSWGPDGTPRGAVDDKTRLRPLVGLRAVIRISPPQLSAVANGVAASSLLLLTFFLIRPESRWLLFALLFRQRRYCLGRCHCRCADGREGAATRAHGAISIHPVGGGQLCLLLAGVLGTSPRQGVSRLPLRPAGCCGCFLCRSVALRRRSGRHIDGESFSETGTALVGVFRNKLFLAVCGSVNAVRL